jgi:hypothetical protein
MIVGATKNPDGSIDYSRAAVMVGERNESADTHPFDSQLAKALSEANRLVADKSQFSRTIESLPSGTRLDMEMDADIAAKFDSDAQTSREEMQALEKSLNNPGVDQDIIIKKIIEKREDVIGSENEARARRAEMLKKFELREF